jgi:hypothetical protein
VGNFLNCALENDLPVHNNAVLIIYQIHWKYISFLHSLFTRRFNATDFLVRLRGKRLMLVGDSMNRNQFESILCLLREGLRNKSRMYEIHGHKISKGRGYFVFKFEVGKNHCILVSFFMT